MASTKTKLAVGLFVIVGFLILAFGVIYLGMFHLLKGGNNYAIYFDESVQGLDRDSPVKYRGVTIGRVSRLGVAPDGALIEVILQIDSDLKMEHLVGRIKSVGITGIMFIELDQLKPGDPGIVPELSFTPPYPVVASGPSEISRIIQGIEGTLAQIQALDIESISSRLKTTFDLFNHSLSELQLDKISVEIRTALEAIDNLLDAENWQRVFDSIETTGNSISALAENANLTALKLNETVTRIDRLVVENAPDIRGAVRELNASLKTTGDLFASGNEFLRSTDTRFSGLERQITITLQKLERAAESLNRYLDRISDNPSQLLFGRPPADRAIERERGR